MLTLAALLVVVETARASGPVGGYLVVDKVDLSPPDAPTKIQIWGSFVFPTGLGEKSYTEPERGYLYFKASPGTEALCRKEWNDLKKGAGSGHVFGFGSIEDSKKLRKVRKADQKPESPDIYLLGNGLVRFTTTTTHVPVRTLLALPAPLTPADGAQVPPGKVTLVTRNIIDKSHPKARYVFSLKDALGDVEVGIVEPGDRETRWTPKMTVKPGAKYSWSVRATEGDWKGPIATSSFVVKGER